MNHSLDNQDDQELIAALLSCALLALSATGESVEEKQQHHYQWRFSSRPWALPRTLMRQRPYHTRFGWR